jgi:hypothetical protein
MLIRFALELRAIAREFAELMAAFNAGPSPNRLPSSRRSPDKKSSVGSWIRVPISLID